MLVQPGQTVPFPNGTLRFLAPRSGATVTIVITHATMRVIAEQRFVPPGVYQPFLSVAVEIQKKPLPVIVGGLLADTLPRFNQFVAPP